MNFTRDDERFSLCFPSVFPSKIEFDLVQTNISIKNKSYFIMIMLKMKKCPRKCLNLSWNFILKSILTNSPHVEVFGIS